MILQIGINGFTASRLWKKIKQHYVDHIGLSRYSFEPTVVEGGLEKLNEIFQKHSIRIVIYTPSPYLNQIPKLISLLHELNFKGRLLFFSSAAIYTSIPPQKRYWIEEAEKAAKKTKFPTVIIRPNLIYGYEGDQNYERLIKLLKFVPIIFIPGKGTNSIQPIHVDDLVEAVFEILKTKETGIIELAGPRAITYWYLIEQIHKNFILPRFKFSIPKILIKKLLELKNMFPYIDLQTRFIRMDQVERFSESRVLSKSRTKDFLKRPLISLEEGIKKEMQNLK